MAMQATTTIPVEVILLPENCYRCGHTTSPVIGLWIAHASIDADEDEMLVDVLGWFLEYDDSTADIIAAACPDAALEAHGAGALCRRTTHAVPDGYLANTCHHCDAVLGNWPLHEAWIEYQAEGGTLDALPRFASALDEAALQEG
jgi:hypothetical protein